DPAYVTAGFVQIDFHHRARIGHRQGAKQKRICQAEHGGIGAYPQSQREYRNRREGGTTKNHAEGVANLLQHRLGYEAERRNVPAKLRSISTKLWGKKRVSRYTSSYAVSAPRCAMAIAAAGFHLVRLSRCG